MIKLIFLMRRKPEMTVQAFSNYWLTVHARLIADNAQSLGVRRYVQCHAIAPESVPSFRPEWDEPASAWDGIAEIWLDGLDMLKMEHVSPEAMALQAKIAADEARFIDLERSAMLITEEHVIVGEDGR